MSKMVNSVEENKKLLVDQINGLQACLNRIIFQKEGPLPREKNATQLEKSGLYIMVQLII